MKLHTRSLPTDLDSARLADIDATHVLCIDHELTLCGEFHAILTRVLAARPTHVVSLSSVSPIARVALDRGLHWVTSTDGPLGGAFVLPMPALRAAQDWSVAALPAGTPAGDAVALWAMLQRALVWHCVPSLVGAGRVWPTPDMRLIGWDTDALHAGTTTTLHHALLTRVRGNRLELMRRYYELAGDKTGLP